MIVNLKLLWSHRNVTHSFRKTCSKVSLKFTIIKCYVFDWHPIIRPTTPTNNSNVTCTHNVKPLYFLYKCKSYVLLRRVYIQCTFIIIVCTGIRKSPRHNCHYHHHKPMYSRSFHLSQVPRFTLQRMRHFLGTFPKTLISSRCMLGDRTATAVNPDMVNHLIAKNHISDSVDHINTPDSV